MPENNNISQEEAETSKALYEELKIEEPLRDINQVESDDKPKQTGKSLGEALDEAPNLSDTQTIDAGLFPKDLGDAITNKLMVGRIFADCFVSLNRILVKRKVRQSNRRAPLDVSGFLAESYVLTTVGIDGKGRVDRLELAGSAREAEEIEKMGKLGI